MFTQTSILKIFNFYPIRLLKYQIEKRNYCVKLLLSRFQIFIEPNWKQALMMHQTIIQFKKQVEVLKYDCYNHLLKSLLLAVICNNVLDLLAKEDKITNTAKKNMARMMIKNRMKFPSPVLTKFKNFLNHSVEASRYEQKSINKLDILFSPLFKEKQKNDVDKQIKLLNNRKYPSDQLQIKLKQLIFQIANTLEPIKVIFLSLIIKLIVFFCDYSQQTSNHLQNLLTVG